MKICFLIQDITTKGGTERTTCCLANEMLRQGHHVDIVSVFCENGEVPYSLDANVGVHYITKEHYGLDLSLYRRICLILSQIKKIKKAPVMQNADWIIAQRLMACVYALFSSLSKKTIAGEHFKYKMYNGLVRGLRNLMYRKFRCVAVLTEKDKKAYEAHGVKHVEVIENMIPIVPKPWVGASSKRILSVGRLDCQKGYDLLLESLSKIKDQLQDWAIDIYGEGKDKESLEFQRHTLGLDEKVHFLGYSNDMETVYANHSIYVMSSRFEGFPMVLLEAMAAGLPVVSFACPEGPEVLLKDGGGILVKAEDTDALSKAIVKMISDETFREKCRNEAMEIVLKYQPKKIYEKWAALFERY